MTVAYGCDTGREQGPSVTFVRVEDGRFYIGDKPYSYVGTNFWYGAILGSKGEGGDRNRLIKELDFLQSIGVNNLRILVGADGDEGVVSKVEPTLQRAPGVYNDEILDGLDYMMMELGKRDMYAVLYLNNSWEWSGGYSQYLQWAGAGKAPIPAVDGWNAFTEYVRQYAKNDKAKAIFTQYVNDIVSRTNRYTGVKYADDTAIMSWQIGNEPRAFSDENKEAYSEWMAATAAQIKALAPNHLVSTGSEGKYGCENDIALWEKVHADPNIDYMTIHMWPNNWGWIRKETMDGDLPQAIVNSKGYIDEHLALAVKYGKPVVMEEFGYPRDGYAFTKESTTEGRDTYYEAIFSYIEENMRNGGAFAGCNFWGWGGFARLAPDHVEWRKGDDYTGDPAQEEQGLNSVFASDLSTVALIHKYSMLLSLSGPLYSDAALTLGGNLRETAAKGYMFGHQDDTVYGVDWDGDEGRSDVEGVAGDYPAVIGFDLGHLELGCEWNLDMVPFERIRKEIIKQHKRGGLSSLSWHLDNPLTLGDSWDTGNKNTVASVLPGGCRYGLFTGWLDTLAEFLNSLRDEDGNKIPVIFRPWHENTGSWFWWGEGLCTPEQYKALWIFTWGYLHQKGANHLLYAYSPSSNAMSGNFEERYPGDRYVDMIGFDTYHMGGAKDAAQFSESFDRNVNSLVRIGKQHDKLVAVTEIGSEGVPMDNWWSEVLHKTCAKYPLSYVLVWRNAREIPGHYYAPYPGHASEKDFIDFYNDPKTLFSRDVKLYR